jgi:predicted ATPase
MPRVLIKSLATNSGFLEDAAVTFADNLTCIIGGRGTCKSTLVESLRFAFDIGRDREIKHITSENGVITKTLGSGTVRCSVITLDDEGTLEDYILERETGSEPRTYFADTKTSAGNRLSGRLEIYSQNALQRIAGEGGEDLRLELIDRPHRERIDVYTRDIEARASELRLLGNEARTIRLEIAKRELQIRELPGLRSELGRTVDDRPKLKPAFEQKREAYTIRRRTEEALSELAARQTEIARAFSAVSSDARNLAAFRERLIAIGPVAPSILQLLDEIDTRLDAIDVAIDAFKAVPVGPEAVKLAEQSAVLDREYLDLRQQEQDLTASLKKEDQLRSRVAELDAIERDVARLRKEQTTLEKRRRALRMAVAEARSAIFQLRVDEADRINRDFGDVVILTMRRAAHSERYVGQINTLLLGSRIRGQEEISRELAEHFSYVDLLTLVEAGDAQKIAATLNRDLGQITRAVSYLRDHPDLYNLESADIEDSLEITMFDRGQQKSVEELSGGQRATALLPLILRDAPYPLVIDQPEDDLDNSFIFDVLVKKVRELKFRRQLIFVTHNANIPVLGDAEEIVVMHMAHATKVAPPIIGTVDSCKAQILHLLEGGEEAFRSREERYGLSGT